MSGNNTFELTGEQKKSIEKIATEPTRAALIADTTGCFARGTEIWTPQGRRPIEVLRSGDDILVFDGTHISVSQVEFMEVTSNQPKPMIEWSHETGKIRATYDHPFYDGERYIPLYQLAWREMGERQRVQLELLCQQYGQTLDNCPSRGLSHRDNEAGNRPFGALENCDGWENYQSSSCGCANMDRKPRESAGSESSGLRSVKQPSRKFGVDNLGGEFSTCVQDGATTGFFGRSACQDCCRQEVFGRTTEVHLGRCSRPDYYGADKNIHRFRGSVSFCDAETDNKCLVQPSRLHGIQVLESEPYYAIGVRGDTKTYIVSDGFPVHNTGKTIVAVYTLLHPLVNAKKTLVICPVSTFDSWRDTLEDHAPHLPVFDVNTKTYASALKQWQDPEATGVWLIGREWFSTATTDLWHKKEVFQQGKLRKVDDKDKPPKRAAKWSWRKYGKLFDVVVYDECHAASNRNSQNSASLRQIEPKRLKVAMSATYQGDKFQGAWAVCRWLWKDQTHEDGTPIVDGSFWRWANQWAIVEFSAFAEGGKQVGAERNPGAFVKSLPCYTRTVTAKKPYQIYRCPLQLGPVQAQQYNSMRDTSIAWLNDHPLVADLPIVQKTRLRQMLLGTIDLSDEDEVVFPEDTVSVKFEALLKIIEREPGEKILVFVDSKKIPPIFSDRLNQQGLKAAHWTGGVSKVRRAKIKERFMLPYDDPDAVNFLVASTTSISDGTNGLQWVCHTEVWLSKAMSGIKNEQAEGRLNRRGQEAERITRYELFVPGTADDEDYERNARKALMRSQELAIL